MRNMYSDPCGRDYVYFSNFSFKNGNKIFKNWEGNKEKHTGQNNGQLVCHYNQLLTAITLI